MAVKTGYPIDPTSFPSTSIAATLLTNVIVYAQKPSRAVITVKRTSGTAVAGASVSIVDGEGRTLTGTTGSGGTIAFENLLVNSYTANATAGGGLPATGVFSISTGNQEATCLLTIPDPGDLTVRVKDRAGSAVPGATVHVNGPSPSTGDISGSPANTVSNGSTSFASLTPGTYSYSVSKAGFTTFSGSVVVVGGTNPPLDVTIQSIAYGNLVITTVKSNGSTQRNVQVRLWSAAVGYDNSSLSSDNSGSISLTGLVAGTYQVYALSNPTPKTVFVIANT